MKNCFLFLCLTISFFSFTLNGETFNKKNAFENVLKEIDDTLNNFKDIKDIVGEEFTQKEAKEPITQPTIKCIVDGGITPPTNFSQMWKYS